MENKYFIHYKYEICFNGYMVALGKGETSEILIIEDLNIYDLKDMLVKKEEARYRPWEKKTIVNLIITNISKL